LTTHSGVTLDNCISTNARLFRDDGVTPDPGGIDDDRAVADFRVLEHGCLWSHEDAGFD
jgi:hypothetical protein